MDYQVCYPDYARSKTLVNGVSYFEQAVVICYKKLDVGGYRFRYLSEVRRIAFAHIFRKQISKLAHDSLSHVV